MGTIVWKAWILSITWLAISPVYTQLLIDLGAIRDKLEARNMDEDAPMITYQRVSGDPKEPSESNSDFKFVVIENAPQMSKTTEDTWYRPSFQQSQGLVPRPNDGENDKDDVDYSVYDSASPSPSPSVYNRRPLLTVKKVEKAESKDDETTSEADASSEQQQDRVSASTPTSASYTTTEGGRSSIEEGKGDVEEGRGVTRSNFMIMPQGQHNVYKTHPQLQGPEAARPGSIHRVQDQDESLEKGIESYPRSPVATTAEEDASNYRHLQHTSALKMMVKKMHELHHNERKGLANTDRTILAGIGGEEESTQKINSIDHFSDMSLSPDGLTLVTFSSIPEPTTQGHEESVNSTSTTISPDLPATSSFHEQEKDNQTSPQKPPSFQQRFGELSKPEEKGRFPNRPPLLPFPMKQQNLWRRNDRPPAVKNDARNKGNVQNLLHYVLQQHEDIALNQDGQTVPLGDIPMGSSNTTISSDSVDTFNIIITKNLTGGQSKPTVQYLPDAKVDAMLLNTSVSSVNNIAALRRVVDDAISNAVATNPIAFQEAIAQVVEKPGSTATVNVVNSSIPDLGQLEATINSLLGSQVVYEEEDRQANTAYGYVPQTDGSVVNRLINNTIGIDNVNVNSTSKTNIVNIFIINIIGGTGHTVVTPSPLPPSPPPTYSPTPVASPSAFKPSSPVSTAFPSPQVYPTPSGPPATVNVNPASFTHAPLRISVGTSPPSPQPSAADGLYTIPTPDVAPPSAAFEPEVFGPMNEPQRMNTSKQGSSTEAPGSVTHDGIILNHNVVLNLLPEFVKATTIPPVVPLYNITAHTALGQKPSVLGLLPNQLFQITRPMIDTTSNNTRGGIVRLKSIGNITDYFSMLANRFPMPMHGRPNQHILSSLPSIGQQQIPHNPALQHLPHALPNNFQTRLQNLPTTISPFDHIRGYIPTSEQVLPRRPASYQSPFHEFNIVSQRQKDDREDMNLVQLTGNESGPSTEESVTMKVSPRIEMPSAEELSAMNAVIEHSATEKKGNVSKPSERKSPSNTGRGGPLDGIMKAVAVGALPSGIAVATALWPYWAPLLLGKRRKRDLMSTETVSSEARIATDWLSILTGNKYKGAGADFPSAWKKTTLRKNKVQNKSSTIPPTIQLVNEKELTTSSSAVDRTTEITSTTILLPTVNDEMPSIKKEEDVLSQRTIPDNIIEAMSLNKNPESLDEVVVSTGQENSESSGPPDQNNMDDSPPVDVIRTTEKATTVKRSTLISAKPTADRNMDQSITQVISSLTSESTNVNEPVGPISNQDLSKDSEKESSNSPDVTLVTNFLYSAINGWNNGEESVTENSVSAAVKEDFPSITSDEFIDIELISNKPDEMVSGTNSPIVFINGVPMIMDKDSDAARPATTFGFQPTQSAQKNRRPTVSSNRRPSSTTSASSNIKPISTTSAAVQVTSPNDQPSETSIRPIAIINNQILTSEGVTQLEQSFTSTANVKIQTTPKPITLQSIGISIKPSWVTRRTTKVPITTVDFPTTARPTTTTTIPRTTTTTPPPRATTTTQPPTTETFKTTPILRNTQTTTASTTTPTTTTTTTTTEPTTVSTDSTTTPEGPGFIDSIASTMAGDQFQSAVGFVGSVAVYGAAALMPLWLPIVLGKKRRKRDIPLDDDIQEILKAIDMPQLNPSTYEEVDQDHKGKTSRKKIVTPTADSNSDLSSLYKHYPSLKKIVKYLKKEYREKIQ